MPSYLNPPAYGYGALADGLIKGFQLYQSQQDYADKREDRTYQRTRQETLDTQNAAQRAAENQRADAQLGISQAAAGRAQADWQDKQTPEYKAGEATKRAAEIAAAQTAAAKSKDDLEHMGEERALKDREMKARERGLDLQNTSLGIQQGALKLQADAAQREADYQKRMGKLVGLVPTMESAIPFMDPKNEQLNAKVLEYGEAFAAGKPSSVQLNPEEFGYALNAAYGSDVAGAIVGQKIPPGRTDLAGTGVKEGAEIKDARIVGGRSVPGQRGKVHLLVEVTATNPGETVPHTYTTIMTDGRSLDSKAKPKTVDIGDLYARFQGGVGAAHALQQEGITGDNFGEVKDSLVGQMVLSNPKITADQVLRTVYRNDNLTARDKSNLKTQLMRAAEVAQKNGTLSTDKAKVLNDLMEEADPGSNVDFTSFVNNSTSSGASGKDLFNRPTGSGSANGTSIVGVEQVP